MWTNNIRGPHLGQDVLATACGENLVSVIFAPFGRRTHFRIHLHFRWLPSNDLVHRIRTASEMGFNRRKLGEQRRQAAERSG